MPETTPGSLRFPPVAGLSVRGDLDGGALSPDDPPADHGLDPALIGAFIARWSAATGSERANYQLLLTELCALLGLPPGLNPGDCRGSAVVVAILRFGQPLGLTGALTGRLARGLRAVTLVTRIACVRGEALCAVQTRPPPFLPHVVSLARSPIRSARHSRKNTQEKAKGEGNTSLLFFTQKEDGEEDPVSHRQVQTSFRSAATATYRVRYSAPCDYIPRRSYPLFRAREVLEYLALGGDAAPGVAATPDGDRTHASEPA